MVKRLKDLKSGPAKTSSTSRQATVEITGSGLLQATTPTSQGTIQVKEVARGNVKRNLFGTSPAELDDTDVNKSNPLPGVNFSFCSPVKGEKAIPDVSIHNSVSSALHQLPPMSDNDTAMVDCNDDNFGQACTENDQWLEDISISAWEGKMTEVDQEVGGATSARVLRRFIIQSVATRQRKDLQYDESQASSNIPRYSFVLPSGLSLNL